MAVLVVGLLAGLEPGAAAQAPGEVFSEVMPCGRESRQGTRHRRRRPDAFNTGNSGGPMFAMNGEVIGIVSHNIAKSEDNEPPGTSGHLIKNVAKGSPADDAGMAPRSAFTRRQTSRPTIPRPPSSGSSTGSCSMKAATPWTS